MQHINKKILVQSGTKTASLKAWRLCVCLWLALSQLGCLDIERPYGPPPDDNPGLPPSVSVNPENKNDGWDTSTPDIEGMDTQAVLKVLEDIRTGRYPRVDSLLVVKNGRLVAESYFNGYGPDTLHDVRSASKSITSVLAGIAVDQGMLSTQATLDELIVNLDQYKHPDPRKAAIKVLNLLNMNSGLECNDWNPGSHGHEEKMYEKRDWVRFVLDLPMNTDPGSSGGKYCTGGVVLIGSLVQDGVGMDLDDFASLYLFEPLGIDNLKWRYTRTGLASGGGGMRLRPRDMAKFGQLFLNRGKWQDQQVLSEQWVEESLQRRTLLANDGYGLLWWKRNFQVRGEAQDAIFASGNGGNFIFLFPLENLVVVFTGSNYDSPLMDQPFDILSRSILPALH